MGREWLYWAGGGGGKGRRRDGRMTGQDTCSPAGCICAVFHLFDFQVPLNHRHHSAHFLQQHQNITSSKGIEAPRNSLELDEAPGNKRAPMSLPLMTQDQNSNFPGGLQIKTRVPTKSRGEEFSSECSSSTSPGANTPNLVARLMGLDVLPQCTSPASSSSNSRSHFKARCTVQRRSTGSFSDDDIRSLSETTRISLARRSDVVEYHRRHLNINNKENVNEEFEMGKTRGRFSHDENKSPGHYARQIVNQVRERVSRRVGLDITNMNRERHEVRRDETLIPVKPTKANHFRSLPSLAEAEVVPDGKPPVRLSDINRNHKQAANSGTKSPRISASCHRGTSDPLKANCELILKGPQQYKNCRKFPSPVSGHAIRKKKEDPFVTSKAKLADRKSKKVPLSSELPVKKDPSPPATKLPQKQSQEGSNALSSKRNAQLCNSARHSYKQQPDQISTVHPDGANRRATTEAAAEYRWYIQRILKRAGIIDRFTWHSPSQPLDPSIFYYLELFHPSAASGAVLGRRCNRKLMFQLVDELLAEILKPRSNPTHWAALSDQFDLTDELCRRIEGFPAANCRILEDIDSLVDKDLLYTQLNGGCYEEERERLVLEIEGEIMESLLLETAEETVGVRTGE